MEFRFISNLKISILPKIIQWLLLLFVFLFPFFEHLLPPLLFGIFLFSLIDILWRKPKVRFSVPLLLLMVFYTLHLIAISYSQNQEAAWFDVQVKLTLLLFPLFLMFEYELVNKSLKHIAFAFVAGEFFALVFCWGHAIWQFVVTGNMDMLLYEKFSFFIHTSYFSMYILLAITIVFVLIEKNLVKRKILWVLLGLFFFISLFFIASKTGIITGVFFLLLFFFFDRNYLKKIWKKLLVMVVLGALFFFVGIKNYRIRQIFVQSYDIQNISPNSAGSFSVRILIWEAAEDIIKENFWTGVGTGDVHQTLVKQYREKGFSGALQHRFNAHNQYLSTFVGLGIFGFLLLLCLLFYGFNMARKKKNLLLFFFMLDVSINFLTESMLNRQAGVLFFAFFFSLLMANNLKTLFANDERKNDKILRESR